MSLMDDSGETLDHNKVPDDDIGKEIRAKFDKGESFSVRTPVVNFWCIHFCIYKFSNKIVNFYVPKIR